ncbi:metal-dependent hydrolase [Natronorubrum halophilum]|uniref:metal-dependent hydrolase n=1 Tax=Natronorubrum halophilum TaxID=1702106 RepID=UPI0010C1A641|nr:metal-dependent hydrolase [Natronorubrum halophilum]
MEVDRFLFLAGAITTHAIVGYVLVQEFTDADPQIGIVLGLLPDVDFYFPATWEWPFVHRGLTHTPLFVLAIVVVIFEVTRDRAVTLAAGLAISSHLVIDSLSPKGINWLFPLESTWSPGVTIHGLPETIVLWSISLGILAWRTDEVL